MRFLKDTQTNQNQIQEFNFQNQNSERNLAERTKQQKAYLAALVVSTAVVVVGISLWVFQDIFRNDSAGVYSNIEFQIVDPKIQVKKVGKGQKQQQQYQGDQSSSYPANKKKAKKGKKDKKGKKGKQSQQNYNNDEQQYQSANRQARYQQQEPLDNDEDGRYQFTQKKKTRLPQQMDANQKPRKKAKKDFDMDPKEIEINFEDNLDEDEKIRGQSLRKKPKVKKQPPQYKDQDSDSEQQYYVPKRQKQMNLDEDHDPVVQAAVKKAKKKKRQQQQQQQQQQEGDEIYA